MTKARVEYEKKGHVAFVTLDRPEVLNAMDLQTHAELAAIWDDFELDDALRVGVLAGRGTRAFSVGQDLKELAQRDQAGAAPSSFGSRGRPGWPRLTERFGLSKPIVAKVCGHAVGGGFELALACDIIVAADNASFALPEARLGLIPGAGGLFRLPRQIPLKVAMGHLMTGRPLTAERAFALGLVNEVAPPRARRRLRAVVGGRPAALRALVAARHQGGRRAFRPPEPRAGFRGRLRMGSRAARQRRLPGRPTRVRREARPGLARPLNGTLAPSELHREKS